MEKILVKNPLGKLAFVHRNPEQKNGELVVRINNKFYKVGTRQVRTKDFFHAHGFNYQEEYIDYFEVY